MSKRCSKNDLFKNLEKIAGQIIYHKKNSCPRDRIHFHYPKIEYVKQLGGLHDMSRTQKLESDWSYFYHVFESEIMEGEFYKRYSNYAKELRKDDLFFYRFISNFIQFCFYKEISLEHVQKIADDFFKIMAGKPVNSSLRNFSFGISPKGNYKINNYLTIKKPQKNDFNIKKIPAKEEFDFNGIIPKTSAIINYTFDQHGLGDNEHNVMERLQTILSIFKVIKIDSLGTVHTSFDYFDDLHIGHYYFHQSHLDYLKTNFSKKDVEKLKNTIEFIDKNYKMNEMLSINVKDNNLGNALRTYQKTLRDLGYYYSETTPYAVKIINGLIVTDSTDSKERFVRRTSNFLYYLGIQNNNTKKILKLAYDWRSNYFHGSSTTKIKKKYEDEGITTTYIELFMLNSARLLLFTLLILKKNSGKELMDLLDDVNTVEGIRKLKTELKKTKKYISICKKGIKINEPNILKIEILEC